MSAKAIDTMQSELERLLERRAGTLAKESGGIESVLCKNDVILDRCEEAICRNLEGYPAEAYGLIFLVLNLCSRLSFSAVLFGLLNSHAICKLGRPPPTMIRQYYTDETVRQVASGQNHSHVNEIKLARFVSDFVNVLCGSYFRPSYSRSSRRFS